VNQTACTPTETQKSASTEPSEKAEGAYLDTEAGVDFAAIAVSHDVVGEWLQRLATGGGI
jgi:hypothetical protein